MILIFAFAFSFSEIFAYGEMPWPDVGNNHVIRNVRLGKKMRAPDKCPIELYEVMCSCWEVDPLHRPSATKVLERLESITAESMASMKLTGSVSYQMNPLRNVSLQLNDSDSRYTNIPHHRSQSVQAATEVDDDNDEESRL